MVPEFQVWYKAQQADQAESTIIDAVNKEEVKTEIIKRVPGAIVGVVVPLDATEPEENRDFLKALAELADVANDFSSSINKVLRTWPLYNGISEDIKDVVVQVQKWIKAQENAPEKSTREKIGIQWDDLPLTLTVKEAAQIMRIGTQQIYQFCHGSMYDFPTIRVGNRFVIPREKFKEWLESQTDRSSTSHGRVRR